MTHTTAARSRLLFFSGGTALRETARALADGGCYAVHVVTPFDSGGSSAVLREAFAMPAVGDMRSRLLALADRSSREVDALVRLLARRLPANAQEVALQKTFMALSAGEHPYLEGLSAEGRDFVCGRLRCVLACGEGTVLPLGGASLGNLVLAGGYLEAGRNFGAVLDAFSRHIHARGRVLPSSSSCAHLAVRLADGTVLVGQDRFTGKHGTAVPAPIRELWLAADKENPEKIAVPAEPEVLCLIQEADLLCYPVGSFYSSVLANLLPEGVVAAVATASCPKLFIPNVAQDPELAGHSLAGQLEALEVVAESAGYPLQAVLSAVLVEPCVRYAGGVPEALLRDKGIRLVQRSFVRTGGGFVHPVRLSRELLQEAAC